jgi:hypothetical protein
MSTATVIWAERGAETGERDRAISCRDTLQIQGQVLAEIRAPLAVRSDSSGLESRYDPLNRRHDRDAAARSRQGMWILLSLLSQCRSLPVTRSQ